MMRYLFPDDDGRGDVQRGAERISRMPTWYPLLAVACVLFSMSSVTFLYDLRLWIYAPLFAAIFLAVPVLMGWLKKWGMRVGVLTLVMMFAGTYALLLMRDRDASDNYHDRRILCAAPGGLSEYQCDRLRLSCGACR